MYPCRVCLISYVSGRSKKCSASSRHPTALDQYISLDIYEKDLGPNNASTPPVGYLFVYILYEINFEVWPILDLT
jgi:hypothetical protein